MIDMRGINKTIIVGTLGTDPDIRYTAGGTTIANLSIATNEAWTDKATGEKNERTEWHRIVLFGKLAEIAGEYLKKGSQAYFEGRLQTRKWQDQSGQDRYTTEIIANEMQMLGGRRENPAPSATGCDAAAYRAVSGGAAQLFDDIPYESQRRKLYEPLLRHRATLRNE